MIGDVIRCRRCGLCREVIQTDVECGCGEHKALGLQPTVNQLADRTIERCPNCALDHELAEDVAAQLHHLRAVADGSGNN